MLNNGINRVFNKEVNSPFFINKFITVWKMRKKIK